MQSRVVQVWLIPYDNGDLIPYGDVGEFQAPRTHASIPCCLVSTYHTVPDRLYDPHAEEWVVVTIDDRLPYWKKPGKYGNLCFAQVTKENELWTCLLEKAVAKFVQSYHRLDGGFESVALEMLTGKPSLCISMSVIPNGMHRPFTYECGKLPFTARHATVRMRTESFDAQWTYYGEDASAMVGGRHGLEDAQFWKMLQTWDKAGCSIACSSRHDYQGILACHAYTLLRVVEVPIVRDGVSSILRLLHVRLRALDK